MGSLKAECGAGKEGRLCEGKYPLQAELPNMKLVPTWLLTKTFKCRSRKCTLPLTTWRVNERHSWDAQVLEGPALRLREGQGHLDYSMAQWDEGISS